MSLLLPFLLSSSLSLLVLFFCYSILFHFSDTQWIDCSEWIDQRQNSSLLGCFQLGTTAPVDCAGPPTSGGDEHTHTGTYREISKIRLLVDFRLAPRPWPSMNLISFQTDASREKVSSKLPAKRRVDARPRATIYQDEAWRTGIYDLTWMKDYSLKGDLVCIEDFTQDVSFAKEATATCVCCARLIGYETASWERFFNTNSSFLIGPSYRIRISSSYSSVKRKRGRT